MKQITEGATKTGAASGEHSHTTMTTVTRRKKWIPILCRIGLWETNECFRISRMNSPSTEAARIKGIPIRAHIMST